MKPVKDQVREVYDYLKDQASEYIAALPIVVPQGQAFELTDLGFSKGSKRSTSDRDSLSSNKSSSGGVGGGGAVVNPMAAGINNMNNARLEDLGGVQFPCELVISGKPAVNKNNRILIINDADIIEAAFIAGKQPGNIVRVLSRNGLLSLSSMQIFKSKDNRGFFLVLVFKSGPKSKVEYKLPNAKECSETIKKNVAFLKESLQFNNSFDNDNNSHNSYSSHSSSSNMNNSTEMHSFAKSYSSDSARKSAFDVDSYMRRIEYLEKQFNASPSFQLVQQMMEILKEASEITDNPSDDGDADNNEDTLGALNAKSLTKRFLSRPDVVSLLEKHHGSGRGSGSSVAIKNDYNNQHVPRSNFVATSASFSIAADIDADVEGDGNSHSSVHDSTSASFSSSSSIVDRTSTTSQNNGGDFVFIKYQDSYNSSNNISSKTSNGNVEDSSNRKPALVAAVVSQVITMESSKNIPVLQVEKVENLIAPSVLSGGYSHAYYGKSHSSGTSSSSISSSTSSNRNTNSLFDIDDDVTASKKSNSLFDDDDSDVNIYSATTESSASSCFLPLKPIDDDHSNNNNVSTAYGSDKLSSSATASSPPKQSSNSNFSDNINNDNNNSINSNSSNDVDSFFEDLDSYTSPNSKGNHDISASSSTESADKLDDAIHSINNDFNELMKSFGGSGSEKGDFTSPVGKTSEFSINDLMNGIDGKSFLDD